MNIIKMKYKNSIPFRAINIELGRTEAAIKYQFTQFRKSSPIFDGKPFFKNIGADKKHAAKKSDYRKGGKGMRKKYRMRITKKKT
jgi:hypothetical protein